MDQNLLQFPNSSILSYCMQRSVLDSSLNKGITWDGNYWLLLDSPVARELRHAGAWHQVPHVAIVCGVVIVGWALTREKLSVCPVWYHVNFTHGGEWVAVYFTSRICLSKLLEDDIINIPEIMYCSFNPSLVLTYLMTGVMWLPLTKLSEVSVCLYRHFCPHGHFSQVSPVPYIDNSFSLFVRHCHPSGTHL